MNDSSSSSTSGPQPAASTSRSPHVPHIRKRAPVSIFAKSNVRSKKPSRPPSKGVAPLKSAGAGSSAAKVEVSTPATTAPSPDDYTDYSIVISKSALTTGLRYHAMKIHSKTQPDGRPVDVNPYDEAQFTRPVRLHRRNAGDKQEIAEQSDVASGVDDKEREALNARKAERLAEKEANQALIAPTGEPSKTGSVKRKKQQKKVEEVMYDENSAKQKARSQLRYEESRPWHLEDFDGKNKWVGSYQEPLSRNSVMISVGVNGFEMVPIEKWYKMIQANRIEKKVDTDKVEKAMEAKHTIPKWMLGNQSSSRMIMAHERSINRGRQQVKVPGGDDDDEPKWGNTDEYTADQDGIDFEFGEEFQDDDEGFLFGDPADDEAKDIEKRIFEEMRGANLPDADVKNEGKDWDEEERQARIKEADEKKKQRKLRKQLRNKERRNEYDSDSERGEYSESSDEDSEEEAERLEEERKREEAAKVSQVNGDKSGTSSRGDNTPNGHNDKKLSLKREADQSETSENESSRKKVKGLNGHAMPPGVTNYGRSLSHAAQRTRGDLASGSDTDTSRKPKSKLRRGNKSTAGSPHEQSPDESRSGTPAMGGSRAQSPQRPAFPTLDEVRAAIPAEGIEIAKLVQLFKQRVTGRSSDFINLVKKAGKQDSVTKLIKPLPSGKS
nr:transcription initiation factor iif subunit alpha [Quercus suber]